MYKKILIVGLVVILAVVAVMIYVDGHKATVAGSGPQGLTTMDSNVYVTGQLIRGGLYSTTLTANTLTLGAGDFTTNSTFSLSATTTSTVTIPATSTLVSWLPNIGDTVRLLFINASSTGGTITIAAGAGSTLLSASSTAVIQPSKMGVMEIVRNTATTFLLGFSVRN